MDYPPAFKLSQPVHTVPASIPAPVNLPLRPRFVQLLFDVFDVDKRGKVTMAELDAMIRMLYGSAEADPGVLRLLAVNGDGDNDSLTFDEFLQVWFLGSIVLLLT